MNFKEAIEKSFYLFIAATVALVSCSKDQSSATNTAEAETTASETIAVAASSAAASADSVYIVQPCAKGSKRDSIGEANLPSTVAGYLSTNYQGYTFSRAYAITDTSAIRTGYVVIIYYNDKPVGLEFDSSGNFVKVLQQREKGRGRHHGGV